MVECTKLHPKMHVAHLGHLFYVLFVHHPDTAKEFFGSGCVGCGRVGCGHVHVCVCMFVCARCMLNPFSFSLGLQPKENFVLESD